jgi:hypothetical protein
MTAVPMQRPRFLVMIFAASTHGCPRLSAIGMWQEVSRTIYRDIATTWIFYQGIRTVGQHGSARIHRAQPDIMRH